MWINAKRAGVPLLAAMAILAADGDAAQQQDDTVLVEGGSFRMGTPESAIAELRTRYNVSSPGSFETEIHAHEVTLSSFRMDPYEVTNARFAAFVAAHPEWGPGRLPAELHNGRYLEHWDSGSYPEGRGEHPVGFVTWHAAQTFCRWRRRCSATSSGSSLLPSRMSQRTSAGATTTREPITSSGSLRAQSFPGDIEESQPTDDRPPSRGSGRSSVSPPVSRDV